MHLNFRKNLELEPHKEKSMEMPMKELTHMGANHGARNRKHMVAESGARWGNKLAKMASRHMGVKSKEWVGLREGDWYIGGSLKGEKE